jgi:polyhydroxyalkanoate synthase subunit PhaC
MNPLSPSSLAAAAENARDKVFRDGVADLRPTPSDVIHKGPQRTVRRYRQPWEASQETPVLLVPPLASPVQCFDLRRGNSLAEHLVSLGYPTYLVDYGWIRFSDRDLGLEHWVEEVIPAAAAAVLADSGAERVQLVGWCLGGIMSLLSVADGRVPAASVAMVASPFDFTRVRLMAPVRRLAGLTGGRLVTGLYRALGGAPSPLVRIGFQLTSIDRYVTKPIWLAQNLDDREALAQTEAVDRFMANMIAYPGRTFGQLYHQFFRVNELSGGRLTIAGGEIDLSRVGVPVLAVAGRGDVLAPKAAVHHVGNLLPNAREVRLETAPGGHLGVLTGTAASATTWRYLDEFLLDWDQIESTEKVSQAAGSPER